MNINNIQIEQIVESNEMSSDVSQTLYPLGHRASGATNVTVTKCFSENVLVLIMFFNIFSKTEQYHKWKKNIYHTSYTL